MENNQEIGKLIKSSLENLDVTPRDAVWTSISNDLDKKKRRRMLFFILPIALSLFVSGLLIFSPNKKSIKNSDNPIIQKSTLKENSESQKTSEIIIDTIKKSKDQIVKSTSKKLISSTEKYDEYEVVTKYRVYKKKDVFVTKSTLVSQKNNSKLNLKKKYKRTIQYNINVKKKNYKQSKKIKKSNNSFQEYEFVDTLKTLKQQNSDVIENKLSLNSKKSQKIDSIILKDKIVDTLVKKKIKKQTKLDSIPAVEDLDEKLPIIIGAFTGPLYYNSLNNSSLLKNNNEQTSVSGNVTAFFGANIRFMFNENFGCRAGLNYSKLNYTTSLRNQNINSSWIKSNTTISFDDNNAENQFNTKFGSETNIDLIHSTTYLEVPIEAYGTLYKYKKVNFDIFGGISGFYMNKNKVYVSSQNQEKLQIGSANNLNSIFGALNFGISFNTKIAKNLLFDISPAFKYQVAVINDDLSFKPYVLSAQIGLIYVVK